MSYYDTPQYKLLALIFDEPDYYKGEHAGLPLVLRRNSFKTWCGYVGIPSSHPLYGKDYNDRVPVPDRSKVVIKNDSPIAILCEALHDDDGMVALDILLECHGGLTYAKGPNDYPAPGDFWWFGFDCNHYGDLSPRDIVASFVDGYYLHKSGTYRTFEYVKKSAETLAEQLATWD